MVIPFWERCDHGQIWPEMRPRRLKTAVKKDLMALRRLNRRMFIRHMGLPEIAAGVDPSFLFLR